MAGGATFSPQLLVDGKRPYDKYPPASEMIPRAILKYLKEPIMPTTFAVISWPLYTALADHFGRQGWSEATFFTVLSCSMITATWAFFNGAYALIEYMRWFDRYKMDRQPHQLGTWKMALSTIRETLIGRLLVAPLGIYLVGTTVLQHRGMLQQVFDLQRPPVARLYLCFLAGSIFNEVAFYWAHRAMHSSYLYARFHKQHHEWKGTVSYAAENAHPVEQLFANYIPTFGGCLLMGAHPWIFILWICERLRTTYEGHSGYAFNVHPLVDALNITNYRAAAQHDFHHTCNSGNFGPQWMDWLCGTMDSWAMVGCEEGYLQSKTKDKLSYMHKVEKVEK